MFHEVNLTPSGNVWWTSYDSGPRWSPADGVQSNGELSETSAAHRGQAAGGTHSDQTRRAREFLRRIRVGRVFGDCRVTREIACALFSDAIPARISQVPPIHGSRTRCIRNVVWVARNESSRHLLGDILDLSPPASERLVGRPFTVAVLHFPGSEAAPVLQAMNLHDSRRWIREPRAGMGASRVA
jgi:hypothetical protein